MRAQDVCFFQKVIIKSNRSKIGGAFNGNDFRARHYFQYDTVCVVLDDEKCPKNHFKLQTLNSYQKGRMDNTQIVHADFFEIYGNSFKDITTMKRTTALPNI